MNFTVCSFSQTPWCLNLINTSYRFAYWWSNVYGLESHWKIVFTYIKLRLLMQYKEHHWLQSSFLERPCLGKLVYPLEDKVFTILWYLQVAHGCWWAISWRDVFHLNEIFLKNRINNTKTLALLRTRKLIADSIFFKRPWNWLLDYCHRFEFNQHRLGLQVLKMAFFDTLGAPLNKQMLWVWIPLRRERINSSIIRGQVPVSAQSDWTYSHSVLFFVTS